MGHSAKRVAPLQCSGGRKGDLPRHLRPARCHCPRCRRRRSASVLALRSASIAEACFVANEVSRSGSDRESCQPDDDAERSRPFASKQLEMSRLRRADLGGCQTACALGVSLPVKGTRRSSWSTAALLVAASLAPLSGIEARGVLFSTAGLEAGRILVARPGMADRALPTASGAPSWVRAVISQVDSQRMRSSVPGPTLGPDAIHTPDSPSEGAASLASTITVV